MKIIVDENISNAEEVFSRLGEVTLMYGRSIKNEHLKDADALVVRSITNVNEELLAGTKVKFVGTATIGRDHIDTEYLVKNNIAFADAKGCNAEAVKEYVITALTEIVNAKNLRFNDLTLGIVGVGNIGSKVAKCAEVLGMKTILNDPPLKRKTGDAKYKELNEVLNADVITMHVPMNKEGIDKTYHLFDYEMLNRLKDNCIIINSSRGAVIDNEALEKLIEKKNFTVVLDVWENEPEINHGLLSKVFAATPHIAGYTYEGKVNGTTMIYSALCRFQKKEDDFKIEMPKVKNPVIELRNFESKEKALLEIVRRIYDMKTDTENMRNILSMESGGDKYFDKLRKDYDLRREFNNYRIVVDEREKEFIRILEELRFGVE